MPFWRSRMRSTIFRRGWSAAGDAEVDGAGRAPSGVMRPSCGRGFGDVHAGQHLDAHRHRRPVGLVQGADLAQHAVDAVADAQEIGFRLEVDVGRLALDGASVRIESIRRTTGWLYSSATPTGPVDFAGFDFVQDAVDRQFVAVILVDGGRFPTRRRAACRSRWPSCGRADPVERDDVVVSKWPPSGAGSARRSRAAAGGGVWPGSRGTSFEGLTGRRRRWRGRCLFAQAFRRRVAQRRFGDETSATSSLPIGWLTHLLQQGDAQLVFRGCPWRSGPVEVGCGLGEVIAVGRNARLG